MEFEQGSKQTFYVTFADYLGQEAVVSGTPTVTISHRWGNGKTIDVDNQGMTLLSGSTYFYRWDIPVKSDLTTYNVRYHGVYSGTDLSATPVVGAEEFQVIPVRFFRKKGGGFVQKVSVKQPWTEKEKDEVIGKIDKISSSFESVAGRLFELNPRDYSEQLDKINDSLSIVGRDLQRLGEINKSISSESQRIDKLADKVSSMPLPERIDFTGIKKAIEEIKVDCVALGEIEKGFSKIGATMLAVEGVSGQLDRLSGSFEEAKELYLRRISPEELVRMVDTEKLKVIKNGV